MGKEAQQIFKKKNIHCAVTTLKTFYKEMLLNTSSGRTRGGNVDAWAPVMSELRPWALRLKSAFYSDPQRPVAAPRWH